MTGHPEKARALFAQGYNCAQSVLASFCDDLGLDFETALLLASSFGGGMGKLREVCGAVSGMFLAAGLKYGYANPTDRTAKNAHYQLIQELGNEFKTQNGSIICRELLGLTGKPAKCNQSHSCADYVACAAKILEDKIKSREETPSLD